MAARGRNDTERLLSHELVYRGVGRTPICAVVDSLPWRGQLCPIAAEVFATTADAYVLLGDLNEDLRCGLDGGWPAADEGALRGNDWLGSFARMQTNLRRMTSSELRTAVREAQCGELTRSIEAVAGRMPEPPSTCIVSGSGEFLAEAVVERAWPGCRIVSLAEEIGLQASRCAPAHAIAVLADEVEKCRQIGRTTTRSGWYLAVTIATYGRVESYTNP